MKEIIKKIPDSEILQTVLSCLKISSYKLGKQLEYKSSMSIYNILAGSKQISKDMVNRINIHYPEVNYLFLTTGEGKPLKNATEAEIHRNLFNSQEEISKVLWNEFASIPERLQRIEQNQIEIRDRTKLKPESELELKTRTFLKEKRIALGYTRSKIAIALFGNTNRINYIYEKEEGRTGSIGLDTLEKWLKILKSDIIFIENDLQLGCENVVKITS